MSETVLWPWSRDQTTRSPCCPRRSTSARTAEGVVLAGAWSAPSLLALLYKQASKHVRRSLRHCQACVLAYRRMLDMNLRPLRRVVTGADGESLSACLNL